MVMDFDRHLVHMVGDSAGHLWLGTWWTFSSSGFWACYYWKVLHTFGEPPFRI